MESNHNPFPWCGECGTWHAPNAHMSIEARDAFNFSAQISRLEAENKALSLKLEEVRTAVREYLEAMYSKEGAHPDQQKRVHKLCGVRIDR